MITYDQLVRLVGEHLGWGVDTSIYTAEQMDTLRHIIQAGYRRFLSPPILPGERKVHIWSFLNKWDEIECQPTESDGTISSSTSGDDIIVTRNGGDEWPAWALRHGTLVVNDTEYEITDLSEDRLELTIDVSADPGWAGVSDWELQHDETYDLPEDYGGMCYGVFVVDGSMTYELQQVNDIEVERLLAMDSSTGRPRYCALRAGDMLSNDEYQRMGLLLYPRLDDTYILKIKYRVNPPMIGEERDDGTVVDVPFGNDAFDQALIEACMVAADEFVGVPPERMQAFVQAITTAIVLDRQTSGTVFINPDMAEYNGRRHVSSITVNGIQVW